MNNVPAKKVEHDPPKKVETIPYIILGHGLEDIANTKNNNFSHGRIKVPEGIKVVTLTQCGNSTFEEEVCPFLQLFTNEDKSVKNMLQDPSTHKKELEKITGVKDLHIYKEKDMMPRLVVQYFARMAESVFKSGIYKYPINKEELIPFEKRPTQNEKKHTANCDGFERKARIEKTDKVDNELISDIFKQSVYPPIMPIKDTTKYKDLMATLTLPFEYVFGALDKPAVYYYVICRAPFKSSKRTVYGKVPKPIGESLPEAFSLDYYGKLLKLNKKFIALEKAKTNNNESEFTGLDIVDYMENHPELVPKELTQLFEKVKPIDTKNQYNKMKNIDEKVKQLLDFNVDLITDDTLRELFESFQENFKGWSYTDPTNILNKIYRTRKMSIAQQALAQQGKLLNDSLTQQNNTRKGGVRRTIRAKKRISKTHKHKKGKFNYV